MGSSPCLVTQLARTGGAAEPASAAGVNILAYCALMLL